MVHKEVELRRLVRKDRTGHGHVFLRECDGGRVFPIVIRHAEMDEIHRNILGEPSQRPMTHDLIRSLLDTLEVRLDRVVVTELRSEVFFARMHFERTDGSTFELDARPSDAIAVASGTGSKIFASEEILDQIGVVEDDGPD